MPCPPSGSVAARHNNRVSRRTPGRERQVCYWCQTLWKRRHYHCYMECRTLRAAGKVEELLYEMDRYKWSILGLCEMRWKKSGEIPTDGGHRVYFSGKEDKHEQGVGFLVHKDIVKSVIGCRPISSRLMTVRLRASPFNITIIQVYAPTSSYDDSDVDEFYRELQSLVDQTPKQDILVVQGDWNAKVGEDAQEDWGEVCGPSCNPETNDRGLKLLDFAIYNNLVLANTLGNHKPSRRWTSTTKNQPP